MCWRWSSSYYSVKKLISITLFKALTGRRIWTEMTINKHSGDIAYDVLLLGYKLILSRHLPVKTTYRFCFLLYEFGTVGDSIYLATSSELFFWYVTLRKPRLRIQKSIVFDKVALQSISTATLTKVAKISVQYHKQYLVQQDWTETRHNCVYFGSLGNHILTHQCECLCYFILESDNEIPKSLVIVALLWFLST